MTDSSWTSADLGKAVCDLLVKEGRLKEKPAFIREDREKKIAVIFASAGLDGAKMSSMNGREVEVAVRKATQVLRPVCTGRVVMLCEAALFARARRGLMTCKTRLNPCSAQRPPLTPPCRSPQKSKS